MNTQELYKWARIALIMLVVFLAVTTLRGLKGLREVAPAYNSITVTGEGEAFALPDVANFSFSVSADADTVSAGQGEVTRKMDAILEALKSLGIEERDVKTSDYSVWPKYVYNQPVCSPNFCPPGRQTQDGYTVTHTVTVKVRDTQKAGQVLAAAGEKGATNLSGLTFSVDDPDEVAEEARALAIKDARDKAKTLSKELGVRLVRVVSFSDSTDGGVTPYYREALGMGGDSVTVPAKPPTVPTGENKVRIVVNIVYEIR